MHIKYTKYWVYLWSKNIEHVCKFVWGEHKHLQVCFLCIARHTFLHTWIIREDDCCQFWRTVLHLGLISSFWSCELLSMQCCVNWCVESLPLILIIIALLQQKQTGHLLRCYSCWCWVTIKGGFSIGLKWCRGYMYTKTKHRTRPTGIPYN